MSHIRFSYWFVLILALLGCRQDVEEFNPYAPSVQEIGNLLVQQIPGATVKTAFVASNLTTDRVLETENGTRVFLIDTDHLFANSSTGVTVPCSTCPDLKIEVTEVFDKSDIVARGLNTVTEDGTLFESGGMVLVTATCNGQALSLLPDRTLKIQLPNNNTQSGFFVFDRPESANTVPAWTVSSQEVFEAEWPKSNGETQKGYELLVKKLGWVVCGRPLSDPLTSFCIELPSGFGGQNTLAYLVFKNQQIVAPLQFDLGQNKFCFHKVPVGYQVQLVSVSKLGAQYWLGKAQTEVGTNATFPLSTQQMTEEAVLDFLKSL